jgi:hypothetical protein
MGSWRQPALGAQQRVKPRNQPPDRTGPAQLLAKQPDRLGIRNRIMQRQSDKPHE